jgi:hypothetical protein
MDTPETMAAALLAAAARAVAETPAVVSLGALKIKDEWKASVARTAPVLNAGAAEFINYDMKVRPDVISAEVGYDKRHKAARLGNLLEFGGGGDHSPPHRDGAIALSAEEPRFLSAMNSLAERLL